MSGPPPGVEELRARIEVARASAHAGAELPDEARLRGVKAAVLTVLRPVTSIQQVCNRALISLGEGLTDALVAHDHRLDRLDAGDALTDATIDDLLDEVQALRAEVDRLRAALDAAGIAAPPP